MIVNVPLFILLISTTIIQILFLPEISYANVYNPVIIDIYGSNTLSVDQFKKRFHLQIQDIINNLPSPSQISEKKPIPKAYQEIISTLKKENKFSYAKLSIIFYPKKNGNQDVYMTVDVVTQKDKARLKGFLPKPNGHISGLDDLIQTWHEYEKIANDYSLKTHETKAPEHCPTYHCTFGFKSPGLEKYQHIFDARATQEKSRLITMLRNDKNPENRATAALLLAHIKNGKELIQIMIPSMRDSNDIVRNYAMRILGSTLDKLKTADFPIQEAVAALNFPTETDRNKALYIIFSLMQQPRYETYIKKHAGRLLLASLKMKQPNLHDMAYGILCKISNQHFGERDYQAWESWINYNNA
jgi:hypothetical protein